MIKCLNMDRKPLREYTHKADSFLSIDNGQYKQWVFRYTFLELEKDLGTKGDITSSSIFVESKIVTGWIIAKEDGIFAGRDEIQYFLIDSDPKFRPGIKGNFRVDFKVKDGAAFKKGDILMEIIADVKDLLMVERVVLNLIMRMSAIATKTYQMRELLKDYDVLITPTRKTLWGLIDKRAVIVGGGGSHRINLSDAILVKDTHLDVIGRDFRLVLQRIADSRVEARFIEIEVESVEEVLDVCRAFGEFLGSKIRSIGVILMDNMSAADTAKAMEEVKKAGLYENLLFEASGGINEKTAPDYAKTGVDIISMGCLTSGIRGVDMSLKVE